MKVEQFKRLSYAIKVLIKRKTENENAFEIYWLVLTSKKTYVKIQNLTGGENRIGSRSLKT